MIEAVADRPEGAPRQLRRRWSDEFKAQVVTEALKPGATSRRSPAGSAFTRRSCSPGAVMLGPSGIIARGTRVAPVNKDFRPWKIDEAQLLPPSVQDYVPKDHLSRLMVSLVRESLDLSAVTASYRRGLGQPPFDSRMMTALLLHGYASGIYSSRRNAKAAVERADFMIIVAGDPPDFRTISEFRKRHLEAWRVCLFRC
ncbi:hypothetical protein XH93_09990 [Bradyrhizobium sp. CCBAU 51753]|nr:transposase [Bradyrhizobium sp. CCBAU 51753]QOZ23908.1 hypothetical protein XH93_09990 [Bradyrhizobium sp. CCBAU 51753]